MGWTASTTALRCDESQEKEEMVSCIGEAAEHIGGLHVLRVSTMGACENLDSDMSALSRHKHIPSCFVTGNGRAPMA